MKVKIGFKIYVFILIIFKTVRPNDQMDCNLEYIQLEKSFDYQNLSMIPSVYLPNNFYKEIQANDIKSTTIPERIFANLCVETISIQGELATITDMSFDGISYLTTLQLSNNKIVSINGLIRSIKIQTLTHLMISLNNIIKLDQDFTPMFINLLKLDLSSNKIEFIGDFIFKNLNNLQELDLTRNRLKTINEFIFYRLENLNRLYLSFNSIQNIHFNAFDYMIHLKDIDLMFNYIQTVDALFKNLTSLQNIYLKSNFLNQLNQSTIINLIELGFLELSHNELSESTLVFQGLENNIQSIYLSYNKIGVLENRLFRNLAKLGFLYLDHNIIMTIESEVFRTLESLTFLDLTNNLIETIPDRLFMSLNNLQNVYFSQNRLKIIQRGLFHNLASLEELKLDGNQIEIIERESFYNIPNLNLLDLSFNKLRFIKAYNFFGLQSLIRLLLNGNRLTEIETSSFKDQKQLEFLDLSDNFLILIDASAFESLECSKIDLSKNQLDQLDPHIFASSKIKQIYISKNQINSLDSGSLCFLTQTDLIEFSFNKLSSISLSLFCDEHLSIKKFNLSHNYITDLTFFKSKQLWSLTDIDVSFNSIDRLNYSSFANLTRLKVLILSNNPIKQIDSDFFKNFNLDKLQMTNIHSSLNIFGIKIKSIDLSETKINDLSFLKTQNNLEELFLKKAIYNFSQLNFSEFSTLKSLDLSGNQESNQIKLASYKVLKWLSLSETAIRSIKRFNFTNFRALKYLNLSHNMINRIEKGDIDAPNLSTLDLSANKITWIDSHAFEDNERLGFLFLDNNNIKQISLIIYSRIQLLSVRQNYETNNFEIVQKFEKNYGIQYSIFMFKLDLSSNSFDTSIHLDFLNGYKFSIQEVYLNDNRLSKVTSSLFRVFDSMIILNLASNQIDSIDAMAFKNMDQLTDLYLQNNSISNLDHSVFSRLIQLKHLNLSSNRIVYLNKPLFELLLNLEILDLSNNQIMAIDDFLFKNLASVQSLYLNNNHDLKILPKSLIGLKSIQNLFISYDVLIKLENKENLKESLKPARENRIINEVEFYKSINIIHDYQQDIKFNCLLVIEFLRKNIQINLRTDLGLSIFLQSCQSLDLIEMAE